MTTDTKLLPLPEEALVPNTALTGRAHEEPTE